MTATVTGAAPAAPVGTVTAGTLDGAPVTVVRAEHGWVAVDGDEAGGRR